MAFARISSLVRNLFRHSRVERELDDELRAYIDQLTDEKIAVGLPPAEAARTARLEAGMEQVKEEVRDVRTGALVEQFAADLRFGARMLLKDRAFAAVAVLTLALGIGATTAVFSVVYGVLLRPLPYDDPDRIVQVWEVSAKGRRINVADPNFDDMRAQNGSLAGLAEYAWWPQSVSGGSQPTRTSVAVVSPDFFALMRIDPVLGRGFSPDDQRRGAAPVALVSRAYWQQHLGATTDIPSLRLTIDNQAVAVVGVLPAGFRFPGADIWMPRALYPWRPSRTAHNWHVVGRLRPGVSLAQARAELSGIAQRIHAQYPDIDMTDAAIAPLREALTGHARPALLVLLGAVGLLLLIACGNVVNLLLAQAEGRRRELAIRAALGAERRRLVRQFLTESLLLAVSGGALGVLAAFWGVRALLAIAPGNLPRTQDVAINLPVLLFALGISIAIAAALGVITALRATRADPRDALAEGSREQAGTRQSRRLGRVLVAAQLAVTLVLLVGAGLLGRSLLRVLATDPGFRTEQVVTVDLALPAVERPGDELRRVQFLDTLLERLRTIPGVQDAGGTNDLPLTDGRANGTYVVMDGQAPPTNIPEFERLSRQSSNVGVADACTANEAYFRILGIPLLRGRLFEQRDTINSQHVAVISESLAREKWPGQDPLGHTLEFGNMDLDFRLLTIVGVVGDVREASLETPPRPTIYVSYRQRPQRTGQFTIVMHAGTDSQSIIPAAREVLRDLDPNVPPNFATFQRVFTDSLQARRFNVTLIWIFAGTALLLAVAGVYGVMAYAVARRTREIGLRMALGADPGSVRRLVLGEGLLTAAAGLAFGILGSVLLTRTMESLLFGVSATDPLTFTAVAALLLVVATLACYLPARRATRVEPTLALRYE